jgi:hypothetical protein
MQSRVKLHTWRAGIKQRTLEHELRQDQVLCTPHPCPQGVPTEISRPFLHKRTQEMRAELGQAQEKVHEIEHGLRTAERNLDGESSRSERNDQKSSMPCQQDQLTSRRHKKIPTNKGGHANGYAWNAPQIRISN